MLAMKEIKREIRINKLIDMAQHISKEISRGHNLDHKKYIKPEKSACRIKDSLMNKGLTLLEKLNISDAKQSINININSARDPFYEDNNKNSFNTKITSISPTKKSLIHKTPTSSESNIASTISIANNLRINQAKATRAIKTKTLSEHMIHSHSSSTLSALRTAEENIKFSMLSRSSAKCQQYKHSSKSSCTSSKDLSMKISKDIKRLQGYGQYTRNVNIEKLGNSSKKAEMLGYVDLIMKTTPIATGELISEESFENKNSCKVYDSINAKSSSELRKRLKSDGNSISHTKNTSNDGRMSQKFSTNQHLIVNYKSKGESGLDSDVMSKTYYLPRKQDKAQYNMLRGPHQNSLKCFADTGSQDFTRTHLLSNLNNCKNWNKFYNASHKILMKDQSNK